MTLTLVIPGLLWPRQVMRDTLYDADFPALQILLGRGRKLASADTSADGWWCSHFGIGKGELAAGPLRLAAAGQDAGESIWLCADPVHLETTQHDTLLKDPALLAIDHEEAAQLHLMLAPLFAEVGELVATTPSYWHLRLAAAAPELPDRVHHYFEHSALALLPQGDAGRQWRRLLSEVQIRLHKHPVNEARRARGQATINSIALWGGGRAPVPRTKRQGTLWCDDPIVAGAARLAGLRVQSLPTRLGDMTGDCIVHWHRLQAPAANHDALAWCDALQQLNDDWLAPALAALASGKLTRVELHGFGDEDPISFSLSPFHRYRFWRKPRRLETL